MSQKRGRHGNLKYVQICCVILGLFVNVLSNLLDKEGRKSNSMKVRKMRDEIEPKKKK